MSTNVSFTGVSTRIPENIKNDYTKLSELAKFLGYPDELIEKIKSGDKDDVYDVIYNGIEEKNKWRLFFDQNSEIGLIYLIDDEYDVFDIEYKMSLEDWNKVMGKLLEVVPKEYLNMSASSVNTFAYLYYNGSENPFTF